MDTDLDDLLTALFVLVDDLLPPRRGAGRPARISDAELITLAVAQILLQCHSERRFLRLAARRLGHLSPYLPKQPGYNERLRGLADEICVVIEQLARTSPSFCDQLRLLDSTPVPCGQSRETRKRSELAGWAAYGYCASHSRYFWGLRLYLLCACDGMPVSFCLAPANEPEREVAAALLDRAPGTGAVAGRRDHRYRQRLRQRRVRTARGQSRRDPRAPRPQRRETQVRGTSAGSGNGSSRSSTPPKASSPSNSTAGTSPRASGPASVNACSRWPQAFGIAGNSGRTASPKHPAATSPTTTTEPVINTESVI